MVRRWSSTRLYGSVIAIVSGAYSLWLATGGTGMTGSGWLMLLLGAVVLLHGVTLLTPIAATIGSASGPLMIAYAVLMLLNQVWMAGRTDSGGMDGGMGGMDGGMGGMDGAAIASPDAGMIAIAVIMFASGVIMTFRSDDGMSDGEGDRTSGSNEM